jgi:O-acetyl-ADP-ribose deacetylase (regulator of RNase III)
MGAGLALEFKRRFPLMFTDYQNACASGDLNIGKLLWYQMPHSNKYILCFPTKYQIYANSTLKYIEAGLQQFVLDIDDFNVVKVVAWPMLGCGRGGLNWLDVLPVMKRYLEPMLITNIVVK